MAPRRWGRVVGGTFLIGLGLVGVWYAARATSAQVDYLRLKYHGSDRPVDVAALIAARAEERYPHNYYLSILMAEACWRARFDAAQEARALAASERWCDLGLLQNPRNSALHLVKANLLAERDIAAAIAHWKTHVDWDYWNAYNHAFLADLYCRAGRFEDAATEVRFIRGTREHDWIAQRLRDRLAAELQPPPDA